MDRAAPAQADASEQLLEAMPDAIVMVGMDGRVARANQQAEAISGYSRDELVGMAVEELVPEALRRVHLGHRAAYQRHPARRSMGTHLDISFRRRDGSEFPADIALSPVLTEQGLLVVASIRDISERKRAEEELLHAQEAFRLVVEAVRGYAIFMLDARGRISTWSPGAAHIYGAEAGEVVGRDFSVFSTRGDVAAGRPARALATAAEAGHCEEEGWRVRKDGSRFWANVIVTAIRDQTGKLLGFAKITRDITERKRADDRLRAVLEVAQAALEGRGEKLLLQVIAERARALAESALAAVVLVEPDQETATVAAAAGHRAASIVATEFPLAASVTGEVLASGRSVVLDDRPAASGARAAVIEAGAMGPSVTVRLASDRRVLGGLAVTNEPGARRFTDGDRELLELFAAQAVMAIDYTKARDDLQRLAVLEDRERIGRELHDGAIQALFGMGMGLQGMALMTGDPAVQRRLEATVGQVDEVIRDLRNYIFGLRPGLAADRQLGRALRELAQQLERQHGVACAVDVDESVAARLAGRAADVVQMTREALSNVGRHAGAATCRLSLRAEAGIAVLEVEDDGHGFLPDAAGGGWGLRNLGERAAAMGGSLEVASELDEGTTIRVRIQL